MCTAGQRVSLTITAPDPSFSLHTFKSKTILPHINSKLRIGTRLAPQEFSDGRSGKIRRHVKAKAKGKKESVFNDVIES